MNGKTNWDEIIVYTDIPFEGRGVFWIPCNKIYIYSLVKNKNYDFLHKYILEHEKKHYLNYNSDRCIFVRILKDVYNEWSGYFQKKMDIRLKNDITRYLKELSELKKNGATIYNTNKLMEKLCKIKPTGKMCIYSTIVLCLRFEYILLAVSIPLILCLLFYTNFRIQISNLN